MPNRFYFRQFLNRPGHHGCAFLLASVVEVTSGRTLEHDDEAWVEFELADCSRRVGLDFPLRTRGQRRNSVGKARLLLSALEAFVAALEEEARLADERDTRARRRG